MQLQRRVRVEQAQTFLAAGGTFCVCCTSLLQASSKSPSPSCCKHFMRFCTQKSTVVWADWKTIWLRKMRCTPSLRASLPAFSGGASRCIIANAAASGALWCSEDDARVDAAIARAMALEDDLADDIDAFDVVDPDLFQFF